ncbi:MAG: MFS transporter [Coriobacteriales bacterium]|nr:MFS transporter [Coriobacteriales bacterium]
MVKAYNTTVRKKDFLWVILFLIIFVNGFESGGYQASLYSIGQTYDLSITSMGLFAALELLADMLAPILLGSWADKVGKAKSMTIMLGLQLVAAVVVFFTKAQTPFLVSMFLLGLTTSALQFIAIAALADAYPLSGKKRIGFLTSMYAFGAVIAPLAVSFYLGHGVSWRALFVLLAIGTLIALVGIVRMGADPREKAPKKAIGEREGASTFILLGILLLCVIMCIYVGFENGFSFFVDTLFTDVFHSPMGKSALSLYWAVMIPSRMLVGQFSKHVKRILLACVIAIPVITVFVGIANSAIMVLLLCVPLGIASGAIYPCVLTLMLPFAGKKTATATGMITAATGIGGFAFTALTGFMADLWGMQTAMMILAAFFVVSILAVLRVNAMADAATGKSA